MQNNNLPATCRNLKPYHDMRIRKTSNLTIILTMYAVLLQYKTNSQGSHIFIWNIP